METFTLKPKLFFGADALSALGALARRRVLVVTDGALARSGLLERVRTPLGDSQVTVFDQVEPDPSLELVARGVQTLRACQPEAVVAFGGGSPIDCAKAMRWSAGSGVPLWAVPTTAGTGSEMTAFAVVTDRAREVKHPLVDDALLPDCAVLDPSLLDGLPPGIVADTGMDALTHAAEAYVSTAATVFTDALAEKAFVLAWQNLPAARAAKGPSPAKEAMLYASCLAGMAFNAAGLGVCHSLAHALGGRLHLPHGRLNAALLPQVIAYNAAHAAAGEKYARLAKLCGLAPTPRALTGALSRLLTALKLPRALPIDDPKGTAQAALDDRCTATNPRTPTQADLEAILRACTG
jgi:alcohol dehydrogenase class IV